MAAFDDRNLETDICNVYRHKACVCIPYHTTVLPHHCNGPRLQDFHHFHRKAVLTIMLKNFNQ